MGHEMDAQSGNATAAVETSEYDQVYGALDANHDRVVNLQHRLETLVDSVLGSRPREAREDDKIDPDGQLPRLKCKALAVGDRIDACVEELVKIERAFN